MSPALYLVDSSIYVFRGWFTLPDSLRDPAGNPVNAVYGFADFLAQILAAERPRHIACAFDESLTSSWRNEIYPDYKANRESAPEELKAQFRLCRELVEAAGLHGFASPLLEADDIIATLAHNARAQRFRAVVVSADKDLTQVLRGEDQWWDFARDRRLSVLDVRARFGVLPEQIADLLALAGDKVDNIPGVPGIGLKTAARLLTRWGDVPNLLRNLQRVGSMKMRGAQRAQQALAEHRESLERARRITCMRHDAALPSDISELARRPPAEAALEALFDRIGFAPARRARFAEALAAAPV